MCLHPSPGDADALLNFSTTYKKDITASGITFSSPLDSLRLKISLLHPLVFLTKIYGTINERLKNLS